MKKHIFALAFALLVSPLFAQDISGVGMLKLTWNDNSDNERGFGIYRSDVDDSTKFVLIDTVGIDVEKYVDTNLVIGQTYFYVVDAFNNYGRSGKSNSASGVADDLKFYQPIDGDPSGALTIDLGDVIITANSVTVIQN